MNAASPTVQADRTLASRLKILVLYAADSAFTSTVTEHLSSFVRHSRHDVWFAHAVNSAPCEYEIAWFDVVIVHYTVRLVREDYISADVVCALASCSAYKVLFIQDEYENTEIARRLMERIGFQAVYTCVPEADVAKVYPRERFGSTEFLPTLTGYVPEALEGAGLPKPLRERPIVVGYRGRALPFHFGRLGQEKIWIAQRMRAVCRQRGIAADIEWTEDRRIYGAKWYEFIGNCRAMLGTESGSNVFDEEGRLSRAAADELRRNPALSFEEFEKTYLAGLDGRVRMNQISPRMFEAIALRTALVLFEGDYSGILRPHEHYIPLAKEFGNVDEVLRRLSELDSLEAMVERAHRDIVRSGLYSYRAFVAAVDRFLESRVGGPKPVRLQSRLIGAACGDALAGIAGHVPDAAVGDAVKWPMPLERFVAARYVIKPGGGVAIETGVSAHAQRGAGSPRVVLSAAEVGLAPWTAEALACELLRRIARRLLRLFPGPVRAAIRGRVTAWRQRAR